MYQTGKLPLPEGEIDRVEEQLSLKFPPDYRLFLHYTNGGIIEGAKHFTYRDGKELSHVAWFYEIDSSSDSNLLDRCELRKGRIPKGFLPIASDGASNEICIDLDPGDGYGKVYFWDHDFELDDDDRERGLTADMAPNYYFVAPSFTEFLGSLHVHEFTYTDPAKVQSYSTPEMDAAMEDLMKRKGLLP